MVMMTINLIHFYIYFLVEVITDLLDTLWFLTICIQMAESADELPLGQEKTNLNQRQAGNKYGFWMLQVQDWMKVPGWGFEPHCPFWVLNSVPHYSWTLTELLVTCEPHYTVKSIFLSYDAKKKYKPNFWMLQIQGWMKALDWGFQPHCPFWGLSSVHHYPWILTEFGYDELRYWVLNTTIS